MKNLFTSILILTALLCFGQKNLNELKALEGLWIAEAYYTTFEKTNSALLSKDSFHYGDPVGLRVNSNEIKNGMLNIGYSVLHDHMLHPEVSEYLVREQDTIGEQGNFKLNLKRNDSLGYYKTSAIGSFNYGGTSYLKWDTNNTSITLYRPKNKVQEEKYIRYKRIKSDFDTTYPFPNPLYYYTRSKTLMGNYMLKDGLGTILSTNFKIDEKGIMSGYEKFQGFSAYYSTDISCGPQESDDFITFYEDILNPDGQSYGFACKRLKNGTIQLYKRIWKTVDGIEVSSLSDMKYELIKIK